MYLFCVVCIACVCVCMSVFMCMYVFVKDFRKQLKKAVGKIAKEVAAWRNSVEETCSCYFGNFLGFLESVHGCLLRDFHSSETGSCNAHRM